MSEDELGSYKSYGITCKTGGGEEHVRDVSTDRELVENMVKRFNRYHLSALHFRDAIEDEIE